MKIKAVVLFILPCLIMLTGCIAPLVAPVESDAGAAPAGQATAGLLPSEPPPFSTAGWETDFTKRSIEWDEVLSGGPPEGWHPLNRPANL